MNMIRHPLLLSHPSSPKHATPPSHFIGCLPSERNSGERGGAEWTHALNVRLIKIGWARLSGNCGIITLNVRLGRRVRLCPRWRELTRGKFDERNIRL